MLFLLRSTIFTNSDKVDAFTFCKIDCTIFYILTFGSIFCIIKQ